MSCVFCDGVAARSPASRASHDAEVLGFHRGPRSSGKQGRHHLTSDPFVQQSGSVRVVIEHVAGEPCPGDVRVDAGAADVTLPAIICHP
jgi:hypothetical protein